MRGALAGRLLASFCACALFAFLAGLFELRVLLPLLTERTPDGKGALAEAVARAAEEKAASTDAFLGARFDQVRAAANLLARRRLADLGAGEAEASLQVFLLASTALRSYLLYGTEDGRVLAQGRNATRSGSSLVWTQAYPFRSADGRGLELVADIDLSPLLALGTAGTRAGVLLLGADYRPVGTRDQSGPAFGDLEFARIGATAERSGDGAFEVSDALGRTYLGAIHRTGAAVGLGYTVLAYAPMAILRDQERYSLLFLLAAAFLMGLMGLAMARFSIRHLTRPLKALELAVRSYNGGADDVALPTGGPREIALITKAYGDFIERARDWRLELEREVGLRTAELSLKGEVVTSLVANDDDEVAYRLVVEALARGLGADAGLIQYTTSARLARVAGTASASPLEPTRQDLRILEGAATRGSGPLACLGYALAHSLARNLHGPEGAPAGIIVLGRESLPFELGDAFLLEKVLDVLGPLVAARETRALHDHVRRAAESALRRSEERLRTFFEESHDMIYTANTDDVIASVNAAGLTLLGCKDRFEAVGRPFSNFVLNIEDRSLFSQRIRDFGFVNDYELVLKRADGSTIFCLETAQAVRDASGAVVEIQGIIKDITERINNERELWRTNMEIAEANLQLKKTQMLVVQQEKLASIGQLAAGVAHEINNPLGFLKSNHAVMGRFSRSLREAWAKALATAPEALGGIATEYDLDYIFTETEALMAESEDGYRRIMDIVKNLKNFARAGADSTFAPYNLNKGLESTLVVAWNEIKYVADVEKDLGDIPEIEADGGGINQVLLNLLVNAAQAIEGLGRKDKGLIRIRTARLGEDKVSCLISDDGPGVPAEVKYRVFDPFYTTKAPGKGTGLGLSISYDIIVNKHGGSVAVEDAPGGGAAFRIVLPVVHPVPPAPAPPGGA